MAKRGVLERLNAGEVLIGDGGFVFALEKRGYVKGGPWTPEVCVEHPEAVRQLHREFLRAGSDIMQALTFYASDDKLGNRGNVACDKYGGSNINRSACQIAREVAKEGGALLVGGVSQTPTYLNGVGKDATKEIFRRQMTVFHEEKVDFIICEYFEHVEEAEWAVETAKEFNVPVAVTLCIGPEGDMHHVPTGECAVRLVKAGADIVGINCHFDPFVCLKTMKLMIDAVKEANLKAHFISQPLAYLTPDAGRQGFIDLPEFPFALEPRVCTRYDMQRYAREAYKMGIRIIGGCCGFEPYHIRALAEELSPERGRLPHASEKHIPWAGGLIMHTKPWVRARARRDYWENLQPATGRPYSASLSRPDSWGVTAGDELLKQHEAETTEEELKTVIERSKRACKGKCC